MAQEKKITKKGERQLKVISKVFPREYNRRVTFPEIRLSGKWLKDLGFNCGRFVIVSHRKNKITITLQRENENK
ncbi:SymE family type I addiction module toxin [Flavivirga aquimarina]|uniref:SymE family type I addiction module toxin n=1 Tax=Flavivirga aquimarina TaxID=2027862 RepID=A0ABT8WBZ2_9FLAO|nr:SymE family type I addiction module toxin [Flavivirga aquimarina]MDO5970582.1 SymE family type I addiction module toxin [Flavivirga aquimarina]